MRITDRQMSQVKTPELKYCPTCKRVWEKSSLGGCQKKLIYHDDIPSYGKPKIKCENCKKKKPAKEVYVDPIKPGYHDPRYKYVPNYSVISKHGLSGYGH